MNMRHIVITAKNSGVNLRVVDGGLKIDATQKPPDNLINLIRDHKADLIAYLTPSQNRQPTLASKAANATTSAVNDNPRLKVMLSVLVDLYREYQGNLAVIGKPLSDASVIRDVWKQRTMRRIGIYSDTFEALQDDLVARGLIRLENHRERVIPIVG